MIKELPCLLPECCILLHHVLLSVTSCDITQILICEKVKQYTTLNKYLIIITNDVLTYLMCIDINPLYLVPATQ